MERQAFEDWYSAERDRYERLAIHVKGQLEKALKYRGIYIAKIEYRAKDIKSATDKSQKLIEDEATGNLCLKYGNPKKEIMDFAGVRVVAYLKTDIAPISSAVIDLFAYDPDNSADKQDFLGQDKIGYNATHFIVKLKESDLQNPTNREFRDLPCEIQIATAFQHSWATVFHDRGYKFGNNIKLSQALIRRTNLIAGTLELLDNELVHTVEEYDLLIGKPKGKHYYEGLLDTINKDSLQSYLIAKLGLRGEMLYVNSERILALLKTWGVEIIHDLENYFNDKFMKAIIGIQPSTVDRVIDCLLINQDLERYFDLTGYKNISTESYGLLTSLGFGDDLDKLGLNIL